MLLDMLSGPVVELVDVKERQVTFRSKRPLSVGKPINVRLSTGQGRAVAAKICVNTSRPLCQGFACSGILFSEVKLPEFNQQRLAGGDPYLRRAPRTDCRLRVLSPDLPGFRALTVDFSTSGLQLEGEGWVEVGQEIRLILEFDGPVPSLDCLARVAWCSERAPGRNLLGLQFVHLSDEARANLEAFERYLLAREDTPILQRLLRPDPPPPEPTSARQRSCCGRVVSYGAEGENATVVFQPSEGPVLRMRFANYAGLSDEGRAVGRQVARLRDLPGQSCVRYQFLDVTDQVVLEVRARDCSLADAD